MPPKGKGKGKSKKRKEPLTEEQKIKQAEQKALAEREKLIRRKRLTTAFLKVKNVILRLRLWRINFFAAFYIKNIQTDSCLVSDHFDDTYLWFYFECDFTQLKKDKEYQLIKLNENKLLDLWRPRLRKLKNDELLEDFQVNKPYN